jgi:hypothetical protein
MTSIVFPNQYVLALPESTSAAIAISQAKYLQPLWHYRAEAVLKLGQHQWIYPACPADAQVVVRQYPYGIVCTAWKLFNRSWSAAAEAYFIDTAKYPDHPRHFGQGVLPLVDEDQSGQQIGWVRILQQTQVATDFAIFVQFVLLELFSPIPLPAVYM